MPVTKIKAFLAEFPWAGKYAPDEVTEVYVSRVTPELTQYRPIKALYKQTPLGDVYTYEHMYFVDEQGQQVDLVRETKYFARKYVLWGSRVEKSSRYIEAEGEIFDDDCTVFDQLQRLKEKMESVRFIVSYFSTNQTLIVYKVPSDVTLPNWIKQQIEAEQAGFKQECKAIDAEAVAA